MRSGFPHSQGGAYSAFQCQSNVGVLPSAQDISTAPVPVVQPENGIQNNVCNMCNFSRHSLKEKKHGPRQRHLNSASSASTTATKSCPLLTALLKGNDSDSKYSTTSSSSSEETNANSEVIAITNPSDGRHCKAQQVKGSLLKCGWTRTQNLDNSGGTPQTPHQQHVMSPSHSSQSSTENVRLVRKTKPPTDDDILDFVHKSVAEYQTNLTQKNRKYEHSNKDSDRVYSPQPGSIMPKVNSVAQLPTTSAPDKEDVEWQSLSCVVTEQYTAAVGQELEEDSSKGSKTNAKFTKRVQETGDCATSASEKHSTGTLVSAVESSKCAAKIEPVESASGKEAFSMNTVKNLLYEDIHSATKPPNPEHVEVSFPARSENPMYEDVSEDESQQMKDIAEYQQIMRDVAVTCTKNEDESRVVLTSMPVVTQVDLTEKQTSLTLNCSMSQEQNNSLWSNSKDLDTKVEVPDDRKRYMPERQSGALKSVEAEGLDSVHSVTDISEDLQTKSTSIAPKNKTFQSTSLSKNLITNTKKKKSIDDQQHCGVTSKKATAHSKLNSSLDKTQIQNVVSIPINHSECLSTRTCCEDLGEDTGCVDSQTDLSMSLSEAKKHAPPYESVGEEAFSTDTVKNPLYEDISDNDMPQLATKLPNLGHWEVSSENPIYEYISEDESQQIEYISGETSSQAPEPNLKQSPFENETYGLVQGQALMMTDIISDEELIPKKQVSPKIEALIVAQQYSQTDPGFEGRLCPKYDSEQQENHSISCSPYPILKAGEETDDEMDDDWLIIPVVVSDLNFDANEQDQDSPQENVLDVWETGEQERQCDISPTHQPSPNPEASAFSPLEVFETLATFQQKTAMEIKTVVELAPGRSTPEHEMDSEGEPLTPQSRRESVDSCETEDSLDYSPELERNFMTVSKKLLESSAPLPSETDVVVSAKEGVSSEVTNTQKVQTSCFNKSSSLQRLGELINVKALSKRVHLKTNGKKNSKKDEVFISGSHLEDECDQNCKKKTKRKRFFSSSSDDSEDTGNSRCETAGKKFQNNGLPSRDIPAQQHQSIHYSSFADLSHSTEECGQMIGTKAASEHIQHNGPNVSKEEIITIHDTDSEDDNYQNYKKTSRKSYFSSRLDSDESSLEETRETSRTEDSECETAEEETQLSFTDSALSQHPAKLNVTQYEEVMQDACSDMSHSVKKSGQLIEAKGECEHVQNTTNRQRTVKRRVTFCDSDKVVKKSCSSQKKANTQELLLSESEDIGDDLVSVKNRPLGHLCRTSHAQPHKNRLSSKYSPEKQRQSADKESSSTLDSNHLIPRFLVVKPSQPAERIHKQDEKGTLPPKTSTVFSKKLDIYEKNKPHLYRNKQGRFVPKPQPENDKHHAKENNIQAKVPKSRTVSRLLPLPSQDSPSTSLRSLPSTSRQLSAAKQRSAYSRNMSLPGETTSSCSATPSKQSSSIPTKHLSSPKLHRSHSTPSTLNSCTNTQGPSFSEKSLRERLVKGWKEGYTPVRFRTRRNGKTSLGMKEDLRTLNDSLRDARPGPSHRDKVPKQRHNLHKTTPLLMKRSRTEAIQRTNDIHRDPTVKQGFVGKNYKWKNSDKANERIELDWEDK